MRHPTASAAGQSERWSTACGKIPTSSLKNSPHSGPHESTLYTPIGISVGSAVFTQYMVVTNRPRFSVATGRSA